MSGDIEEAKRRLPLPELIQRLGLGDHAKKSARCPFHEDKHNSFSVWQKDGAWFFKCHVCCGAGDEINFLEVHKHLSRSDATKLFLEMAGSNGSSPRVNRKERPLTAQFGTDLLAVEDCRRAVAMAVTLRDDPKLCERIATVRGWKPETIRDLTVGPHLGWHEGKLAFIYETGVKLRWR
jgi:hypothetical protein